MALSTTCSLDGKTISINDALALRTTGKSRHFKCVECNEPVRAHKAGGDAKAHFEHFKLNLSCPYSHGGKNTKRPQLPKLEYKLEDTRAIEGYLDDLQITRLYRNKSIVIACKKRDNNTCQACGFHLKASGKYIIDCHHKTLVSTSGIREVSLADLVCLCPTCHRVAHLREQPLTLDEIRLLRSADSPSP